MKLESLRDLFVEQLQDLYSAESQLIKALPKMANKATNLQLKKALEDHLVETEKQKKRLDEIFELLSEKPGHHTCKAMAGLIAEAEELFGKDAIPEVMDAGIIACANRVEHYEIAGYGTTRIYAKELSETEAEKLLIKTLDEEIKADALLTKLAETTINLAAL